MNVSKTPRHLAGAMMLLACAAEAGIQLSIERVAENQTADPSLYDGEFDVYHVTAEASLDAPHLHLVDLSIPLDGVIRSPFAADIQPTAALPAIGDTLSSPHSFLVVPESIPSIGAPATHGPTGFNLAVAGMGDAALISPGSSRVIAVVSVEAGAPVLGSPFADAPFELLGYSPLLGEPDGSIPGDGNQDGVVDLVDFALVSAEYPTVVHGLTDLNGDGASDLADWTVLTGNLGRTLSDVEVVVDAVEFGIDFGRRQAADFNADGRVNLIDLNILGMNFGVPNPENGDADGDGDVDLVDLNAFNQLEPFPLPSHAIATPEPAGAAIATLVAIAWTACVRNASDR